MNESDDSGAPAIPRLMLTADEVATALGIGRTRVFNLMATGELKSVKIGRSRRVTLRDCEEFIAQLRER